MLADGRTGGGSGLNERLRNGVAAPPIAAGSPIKSGMTGAGSGGCGTRVTKGRAQAQRVLFAT
jgi:hypothetical protein